MSSSQLASATKRLGWRERVQEKTSSRVSSSSTQRPPTFSQSQALRGSYSTSCLLPKPPPTHGLITRTSPQGISRARPMEWRMMCGIWVEVTQTMRLPSM